MARGVVFHDSEGRMHKAYLNAGRRNEIILSAGAMGSPQLLMLSGVGSADHLSSFGIRIVHDQPAVGQGMSDNPMNAIYVPSPSPVEISLIQVVGITQVGSYIEGASGSNWGVRPSASGGVHRPRNFGMFSPQVRFLPRTAMLCESEVPTQLQLQFCQYCCSCRRGSWPRCPRSSARRRPSRAQRSR